MAVSQAVLELILKLKDEASEKADGIGESFRSIGPAALAGVAGVAGAAVMGVGVAAFDTAQQVDAANAQIRGALGVTAEEAEALGAVAVDVFANNFGGSIEEAAAGLVTVQQQMRGLSPADLQGATQAAFNLQQAFGVDMAESTNAANTLMSQFGLTSQQAFDFLAQGFQKGLDNSGDFIDTIGEYGTQFANGGADAAQFFSALETGQAGGVLGTDKMADAFKEFRLRIQDGSEGTAIALGQLGINADALTAGLADGSITAADAFGMVTTAINATEDPTLRMQTGAALIGSQFEDLGDSAFQGLNLASTSLGDMAGSLDATATQSDTFGSRWEETQRKLMVATAPLGEVMLDLADKVMPLVIAAVEKLAPWLEENLPRAIEQLVKWWGDFNRGVAVVQGGIDSLRAGIQPVIDAFQSMQNSIGSLDDNLPDWLRPGSPTPLELGLRGINNAMGDLSGGELPALEAGLDLSAPVLSGQAGAPAAGGVGAGAGVVYNVVVNVAGSAVPLRELAEEVRAVFIEIQRDNGTTGVG